MNIRPVSIDDASAIADIYNHYVLNTTITFEETAISAEEMARRIQTISEGYPYLVLEEDGEIIGYSYAGPWKPRSAYRFTVESAVYLRDGKGRAGRGETLYRAMLDELRKQGIHLVLAGITIPNDPSIALHEKLGFTRAARFNESGWKFDRWLDVGYWQLIL